MTIELTPEFVFEVWDNIKQDIPEKNRELVAKDFLVTLEENMAINEEDMRKLKLMDADLKLAVESIYIEDEVEGSIESYYDEDEGWDEEY